MPELPLDFFPCYLAEEVKYHASTVAYQFETYREDPLKRDLIGVRKFIFKMNDVKAFHQALPHIIEEVFNGKEYRLLFPTPVRSPTDTQNQGELDVVIDLTPSRRTRSKEAEVRSRAARTDANRRSISRDIPTQRAPLSREKTSLREALDSGGTGIGLNEGIGIGQNKSGYKVWTVPSFILLIHGLENSISFFQVYKSDH